MPSSGIKWPGLYHREWELENACEDKDYIKDVFAKDLPLSIWHFSIQAVREELKVMQERTDGKQRVRVPVNFRWRQS